MSVMDGAIAVPQDAEDEVVDSSSTTSNPKPDDSKVEPADQELVKLWIKRIRESKHEAKPAFKQIRENRYMATHGATRDWLAGKNYVVAIVNRHIKQAVASLYARDPVAQAKPRDKMRFTVWDGRQDTLQAALELLPTGDQQSAAIVQDVLKARQLEDLVKKNGRTLEILWKYFTSQQSNGFKQQLKALVRRTKVDGVGYIKLAFQRVLEPRPEIAARIEDTTSELARTELLLQEKKEGDDWEAQGAKAAELKYLLEQLKDREYMVVREGPVFDFPKSTRVIVDMNCTHLKTLTGARWVAHEIELTDDEIVEIYHVDKKDLAQPQNVEGDPSSPSDAQISAYDAVGKPKHEIKPKRLVWEVQDKQNSQFLTVCDGYDGFLSAPAEPEVKIDRFFTIYPLVFNEIESEDELYPPSDVELLKDTQMEYNRARQGLREHRQANRPKYLAAAGTVADEDLNKLAVHPANAIIELRSLKAGDDAAKLLQRMQMVPIDPAQYGIQDFFSDIERIVGTQQANLGTGSNTTATESSIVEQGRQAGIGDDLDDLDDLLSQVALGFSQLCLAEMSIDMVQKIVGPGAVWPDAPPSRQDMSENVYLDIKAGSTGRPNRAVDLANIEKALPLFLQIPGTNLATLRDKAGMLLDLDPEELVADGVPSVTAINAMMVKAQAQAAAPQGPGGPGLPPGGPQGAPSAGPNPAMQGAAGHAPVPMHQGHAGPQPGMTAQTLPPHA